MTTARPADFLPAEMDKLTRKIGDQAQSEEDVLTYAMFPEVGREFLQQRAAGNLTPEPLESPPGSTAVSDPALNEFNVMLHGQTYHIKVNGCGHQAGAPVLVIEAMKMESGLPAPVGGRITAVHIKKGDRFEPGDALFEIE